MNMLTMKYEITAEQKREIEEARKKNKDKRIEAKLKVRLKSKAIGEATGYNPAYVSTIVSKYIHGGLEAIVGNHYAGNHRNMSFQEEAALLEPFMSEAEKGQMLDTAELEKRYEEAVGHRIGSGQIYRVLQRHDWRKVMPRSKHPKKASEEVIETSKKLTMK